MISTGLQTFKKYKVSVKKLLILVDNKSDFQISKLDFKNFRSMDVDRIRNYFITKGFIVQVKKIYG